MMTLQLAIGFALGALFTLVAFVVYGLIQTHRLNSAIREAQEIIDSELGE